MKNPKVILFKSIRWIRIAVYPFHPCHILDVGLMGSISGAKKIIHEMMKKKRKEYYVQYEGYVCSVSFYGYVYTVSPQKRIRAKAFERKRRMR